MAPSHPPLIWIDMEMSGLDPKTCTILEIAAIVTNERLEVLDEGIDIVIHHPEAVLDAMDDWNTQHHGASGLTDAVRTSTCSLEAAEERVLEYLRTHTKAFTSPLCGNTVGQDRRFAEAYMPSLASFLHYRTIDVSTIKELASRWYPQLPRFPKQDRHRALDDILESIRELAYYREHVFLPTTRTDA